MKKKSRVSLLNLFLILSSCVLLAILAWIILTIPQDVKNMFGAPTDRLSATQKIKLTTYLWFNDKDVLLPIDPSGNPVMIEIEQGQSVRSIAEALVANRIISEREAFINYLIYRGADTSVRSGKYRLSPAMNIVEISEVLLDPTPEDVQFGFLSGMRTEELAQLVATSGMNFTSEDFLAAMSTAPEGLDLSFFGNPANMNGLLAPKEYTFLRAMPVNEFIQTMLQARIGEFTPELVEKFATQGLTPYEALILASVVEREAVVEEEKTLIASVFLNRLKTGMKLESDPTVQYAIGYIEEKNTWWKSPLYTQDLQTDSPYNTYRNAGLPPTPICFPSISSIAAVANPAETNYYFFRALCDNSGKHVFTETFDEHLKNSCE